MQCKIINADTMIPCKHVLWRELVILSSITWQDVPLVSLSLRFLCSWTPITRIAKGNWNYLEFSGFWVAFWTKDQKHYVLGPVYMEVGDPR